MWLIQCRIFQTSLLGLIWKIIKFQLNISTFQRQQAEVKRRKWENYSSKHAVTWLGDFVLSSGSHCTTLIWGGDFCFINVLTLCVTQGGELSNKLGEIGAVLLCRHYVKWEKCNCLLDSEVFLICFEIDHSAGSNRLWFFGPGYEYFCTAFMSSFCMLASLSVHSHLKCILELTIGALPPGIFSIFQHFQSLFP